MASKTSSKNVDDTQIGTLYKAVSASSTAFTNG